MNISADNITKVYHDKSVFSSFSYQFTPGVYCIQGRNGCGKSTLLRILGGLDKDYSGTLTYGNRGPSELNHLRTFLPDTPETYPNILGKEFIELIAHIRKIDPEKYVARYRDTFHIDEFLDLKFKEMSLGQKKKLFAVISLLDEVKVWIMDEPTNGLDIAAVATLQDSINTFSQHGIVILAEHKKEFLAAFRGLKVISL